ncbi:MAG: RNase P subunit p30 family protein [Nanoarchaeota archaeon]
MITDYVFPQDNEKEFVEMGKRLGYDKLVFVYNYGEDVVEIRKKINNTQIEIGLLSLPKNIGKAQKITKHVIVRNSKDNRFVIEKNKDLIIFNLEDTGKKEYIHHRSSGLNQVLCKLASENNITVAFSFNSILKADREYRSKLLGRIKQNVRFCNKYKVKTAVYSFAVKPYGLRNYKDLKGLLQ